MIENPIVAEVHRIREQILAEYDGDLHALIRDSQRKTDDLAKAGRVVVTRGPRPVTQPHTGTEVAPLQEVPMLERTPSL